MSRKMNNVDMSVFGQLVYTKLKEKNMSQKDLASRLYISQTYLSRLMYGAYPVQMRTIKQIAKEIDMDASDLAIAALKNKN